jgi:uncharacterized integral membrane protein
MERDRGREERSMRREDDPSGEQQQGWVEKREGPSGLVIWAGIAFAILLIFILQNSDEAHVDFLFLDGDFPLWGVILVGAILGFLVGWFLGRSRLRRRERRN